MSNQIISGDQLMGLANLRLAMRDLEKRKVFAGITEQRNLRKFPTFAAKQLQIIHKEEGTIVPFRLRWIQWKLWQAELRARRRGVRPWFLILKYRRGGVSTYCQGRGYHMVWAHPFSKVRTYAHRQEDTRTVFEMVTTFYEYQPERHRHRKTSAGTYAIEFPDWHSDYKADTAGATSSGRGSRLNGVHLSEAAFYPDLATLHAGLNDTVAPDGFYLVESTPNGKGGKGEAFYEAWQKARSGDSAFVPLFFPWFSDPNNQTALIVPDELGKLEPEVLALKKKHGLSLEQVKWWLQKRRELVSMGREGRAVYQEHPNDDETCFIEGGEGYYDTHLIAKAESRCIDPIRTEEAGRLRIFEEPSPDGRYLITADPAEGVGRDDSAATGWNIKTGRQAFTWRDDRTPPDMFGVKLAELGRRWSISPDEQPAYIMVERENHGHAVLLALMRLAHYPKNQVHHEVAETHDERQTQPRAGWRHNHIVLTTSLGRMLREEYPIILDREVISSIRRVSLDDKGTAEFTGRDLAVTAGLAPIGFPYAERKELFY